MTTPSKPVHATVEEAAEEYVANLIRNPRVTMPGHAHAMEKVKGLLDALELIENHHPRCECQDSGGIARAALQDFKEKT